MVNTCQLITKLFCGERQLPDGDILWLMEICKDLCILLLVFTQFPLCSRASGHWIVMPEWLWCSNSVSSVFLVRLKRKRENGAKGRREKGGWEFLCLSPIHINIGAIQVEEKGGRGNDNNPSFWKSITHKNKTHKKEFSAWKWRSVFMTKFHNQWVF